MAEKDTLKIPRQLASWEKYVKKYVWDDDSTPYLVPVRKLKQYQADKELFLYVFFLATPSAMLLVGVASRAFSNGNFDSLAIGLYALSVLCAAIYLRYSKSVSAALYTITAPFALLLHFAVNGFPEKLHTVEQLLLVIVILIWLRYTVRIVAIAKAYPGLSTEKKDNNPWSKFSDDGQPPA